MFLPRQRFGTSSFPTPLLVLLRFLLPASSLKLKCSHSRHRTEHRDPTSRASAVGARLSSSYLRPRRLNRESATEGIFAHLGHRVSTSRFLDEVTTTSPGQVEPGYETWRVVSITWVKALASHMSHEFIQFVAEDEITGRRTRLIADRQETGDWVSVTPNAEQAEGVSDMFAGMESQWSRGGKTTTPYQDRHMLPLPLVSLVFDSALQRPRLSQVAELLVNVSARCTEYNPLREHCWWFSEAVMEGARERWVGARLEEWEWARYRYSFVICNRWIRRKVLETAAKAFEKRCLEAFAY